MFSLCGLDSENKAPVKQKKKKVISVISDIHISDKLPMFTALQVFTCQYF